MTRIVVHNWIDAETRHDPKSGQFTAGKFLISKEGNRHVVRGQLHQYSNGGKTFGPENYARAFKTKQEAEFHAGKMHSLNVKGIAEHENHVKARKEKVQGYLASRQSRSSGQGELF